MSEDAQNNNTDQLNLNSGALSRVNSALDSLGGIVGALVKGAPQSFGEILDKIPGLDGKVAQSMKFAEGYIGVWQGLTRSGVNFNNQIDEMIIATGRANIQLEQLSRMVSESGGAFAAIGGIAQNGVDQFLASQTIFNAEVNGTFNPLRVQLERLGYTSETINESFLAYDQIQAISGIRDRRIGFERNRAATDFAKTMDELSRLTGKQIKQLEQEAAEISRQGNIFAFSAGLDTSVKDELRNGLQELNEVAPVVKDFATDLITRGFPNPNDPAMMALNAAAPELRESLLAARDAFLAGDETRAQILMGNAIGEAKMLRHNQFLIRQAMLGGATEITGASMDIVTQLNSGIAVGSDAIREFAANMFNVDFDQVTGEQMDEAQQKMIAENIIAQEKGSEGILDAYLGSMRTVQSLAMEMQEDVVNGMFSTLETGIDKFQAYIDTKLSLANIYNEGMDGLLREILGDANSPRAGANVVMQQAQNAIEALNRRATELSATDDQNEMQKIQQIVASLETNIGKLTANANDDDARASIRQLTGAINRIIIDTNPDLNATLTPAQLQNLLDSIMAMPLPSLSTGTMGQEGKLFQNFGRETLAKLHGLEAVVTPDQMQAIVSQSALGAVQGMSSAMNESRNTSTTLQGMLNTIRTIPAQVQQPEQIQNETNIEEMMNNLTRQLKAPLEEAMKSTLVPKLEQLVSVSTQNVEMSNKVRKGISGLDGDMLRSM